MAPIGFELAGLVTAGDVAGGGAFTIFKWPLPSLRSLPNPRESAHSLSLEFLPSVAYPLRC